MEKFIGDAVMAVFGIPVSHEDDALRAVRAAAEIRERLAALGERAGGRAVLPDGRQHGRGRGRRGGDARHRRRRQRRRPARAGRRAGRDPDRRRDALARAGRRHGRAGRAARAEGEARAGPCFPAACRRPDGGRVRAASRRAARRPGARAAAARSRLRVGRVGARLPRCSRCWGPPGPASRGSSRSFWRARARPPTFCAPAACTTARTSPTGRSSRSCSRSASSPTP